MALVCTPREPAQSKLKKPGIHRHVGSPSVRSPESHMTPGDRSAFSSRSSHSQAAPRRQRGPSRRPSRPAPGLSTRLVAMMPGHTASPLRSGGSGRRTQTRAERWDETSPHRGVPFVRRTRSAHLLACPCMCFPDGMMLCHSHLLLSSARLPRGSGKRQTGLRIWEQE
jgi:hypothetical protein